MFDLMIVYHGWPSFRNVFESLIPLAYLVEVVPIEKMDVLSWWYISEAPNTMNVSYAFYFLEESDAKIIAKMVGGTFFGNSLATEILNYWDDDDVDLSVYDISYTYVELEETPTWGQWELAFLSAGVFILTLVCMVLLIALIREYHKKKFREACMQSVGSHDDLLRSSPRNKVGDYQFESITPAMSSALDVSAQSTSHLSTSHLEIPGPSPAISEIKETDEDDLKDVPLEPGEHKVDRINLFKPNPKIGKHSRRATVGTHTRGSIHDAAQRRPHMRSMSYADPRNARRTTMGGRVTSTEVRDLERMRRKTVFKEMRKKSSPKKAVNFDFLSIKEDSVGDVNVPVRPLQALSPS